jgi:TonB family protein
MRRDDVILTVAMCISLVVHGAICLAMVSSYGGQRIYFVGAQRSLAVDPDSTFGETGGMGDAPNSLMLDREMQGRLAPSPQAFLSRDPAARGKVGGEPTMNVLLGEQREPQPRGATPQPIKAVVLPARGEVGLVGAQTATWSLPSAANHAADPAPMTESESDSFGTSGSVEISAGNVEARLGRKVKTVRPRLSFVAEVELFETQSRSMRLRVHLDRAGKVKNLIIARSSGSKTADQEVKLAVYEWEFEARPNRNPDVMEFDLVWR